MMVKIALKGYARSGKDTVGQLMIQKLQDRLGGVAKRFAFGDELRCRIYNAFPELDPAIKQRQFLETFAQLGRDIDPDIWVKALDREMFDTLNKLNDHFIVTDLRQPNEAEMLRKRGFVIVEVWAPEKIRKARSKDDSNFQGVNHSERRLHEIGHDFTIYNLGDLENLEDQVEEVLDQIIEMNEWNKSFESEVVTND